MDKPIIKINNLGKQYVIGKGQRYLALRDKLAHPIRAMKQSRKKEKFWALKDINFEVKQGEVLGIIGKNGAGKSTLLKVLSQITPPTTGEIKLRGRVGSLLEVGTGFHPELTGRENIYLNGAILGMRKKEIEKKFDEIVEFSGIDKFLDTPVKRYSSGMYVRLAFSVAAHLEPDILIIDEVLSVGDAEFQKKCLGKMEDVTKKDGRTILFVSHNMGAIKKLCDKGILLDKGEKVFEGDINSVVDKYNTNLGSQEFFSSISISEIDVVVDKIKINSDNNGIIYPGRPMQIDIEMTAERDVSGIGIQLMLSHDDTSGRVFSTNTKVTKGIDVMIKKGKNRFTCLIEKLNLCSGRYRLGFGVDVPFVKFYQCDTDLFYFDVLETMFDNSQVPTLPAYGHVYLDHKWIIKN